MKTFSMKKNVRAWTMNGALPSMVLLHIKEMENELCCMLLMELIFLYHSSSGSLVQIMNLSVKPGLYSLVLLYKLEFESYVFKEIPVVSVNGLVENLH